MVEQRRVKLPLNNKNAEDLLMWRDPKKSSIIFGGVTFVYLMIDWSGRSIFNITAWAVLLAVVGGILYGRFAPVLKLPRPSEVLPRFLQDGITEKQLKQAVDDNIERINILIEYARAILYGEDLKLSAKIAGALALYIYLFSHFSLLSILYLGALVAFSVPKLYELRKDDCDRYIAMAKTKGSELYKKVDDRVIKNVRTRMSGHQKKVD